MDGRMRKKKTLWRAGCALLVSTWPYWEVLSPWIVIISYMIYVFILYSLAV